MTPDQFKQLLATTGRAQNITVEQNVEYHLDEQYALQGEVEIIDCRLPLLSIAEKTLDSLTISGGKIWQLQLQTGSHYGSVTVRNCIIDSLYLDETTITNLSFFPADNNRPTITSGSTSTSVSSAIFEGNYKDMRFTDVRMDSFHLKKVILNTIDTLSLPNVPNILFENVKANSMRFHFANDTMLKFQTPDGLKFFTNVPDFN